MIKDLVIERIAINKAENLKIAVVQSTYHAELNASMTEYCKAVLLENHILEENIKVYHASGSWELPLIVKRAAKSKQFDAIIVFSILVRGDTYHFDMIANEVARALMDIMLEYHIPIGFEVLAVNSLEQAMARTADNNYNKGIEAGNAVLKTLQTLQNMNNEL